MNFFRIPGPSKAVFMTMGACILLSGCNDDFGYRNLEGKQIAFNITASDAWHDALRVGAGAVGRGRHQTLSAYRGG